MEILGNYLALAIVFTVLIIMAKAVKDTVPKLIVIGTIIMFAYGLLTGQIAI